MNNSIDTNINISSKTIKYLIVICLFLITIIGGINQYDKSNKYKKFIEINNYIIKSSSILDIKNSLNDSIIYQKETIIKICKDLENLEKNGNKIHTCQLVIKKNNKFYTIQKINNYDNSTTRYSYINESDYIDSNFEKVIPILEANKSLESIFETLSKDVYIWTAIKVDNNTYLFAGKYISD